MNFRIFTYLFLPEGIMAFSQNREDKTAEVKAELCTHYLSNLMTFVREIGLSWLENNAQNGRNEMIRLASRGVFLD